MINDQKQTQMEEPPASFLNIMLVDDEPIVRRDIKTLIDWEANGYRITAEAENGQEALKQFRDNPVDIIIADIEMQGMTGLALAEHILSGERPVKFIFLTAYSNFEFARASMRLGIDSYILKHELTEQTLLMELARMRNELQEKSDHLRFDKDEAIRKLLCTDLSADEYQKTIKYCNIWIRDNASFFLIVDTSRTVHSDDIKKQIASAVYHATVNDSIESSIIFPFEEDSVGALIILRQPDLLADYRLLLFNLASAVQTQVQYIAGYMPFIIISRMLSNEDNLRVVYQKTKSAIEYIYFYQKPGVILCELEHSKPGEYNLDLNTFCSALDLRDYDEAKKCLSQQLLPMLVASRDRSVTDACLAKLTDMLTAAWHADGGDEHDNSPITFYRYVIECPTIYEACNYLNGFLDRLINLNMERQHKRFTVVKDYIDLHYSEDISLESLAGLIGVSETYMSQLFKQQIGVSFKIYLTNIRINKAKEMLLSGKYKIYEVGEKVGYNSTQYFCNTFKQVTKKRPTEFVKRYTNGKEA